MILRLLCPPQEDPLENRPYDFIHVFIAELDGLVNVLVPALVLGPRCISDEMEKGKHVSEIILDGRAG